MEKRNIDMMPAFIFVWYQTVTGCRIFIKGLKYHIRTQRVLSAFHLCVLWKGKDMLKWHPREPDIIHVPVPPSGVFLICLIWETRPPSHHLFPKEFISCSYSSQCLGTSAAWFRGLGCYPEQWNRTCLHTSLTIRSSYAQVCCLTCAAATAKTSTQTVGESAD